MDTSISALVEKYTYFIISKCFSTRRSLNRFLELFIFRFINFIIILTLLAIFTKQSNFINLNFRSINLTLPKNKQTLRKLHKSQFAQHSHFITFRNLVSLHKGKQLWRSIIQIIKPSRITHLAGALLLVAHLIKPIMTPTTEPRKTTTSQVWKVRVAKPWSPYLDKNRADRHFADLLPFLAKDQFEGTLEKNKKNKNHPDTIDYYLSVLELERHCCTLYE